METVPLRRNEPQLFGTVDVPNLLVERFLGLFQVIQILEVQPECCRNPEEFTELEGGLRADIPRE